MLFHHLPTSFLLLVLLGIQPWNNNTPACAAQQAEQRQFSEVVLTITNIKGQSGQLCIAVFDSDEAFRNEKPLLEKKLLRRAHDSSTLILTFPLPPGDYGISVLDDADANGRMKYGFAGIPLEGFGLSGYQQKGFKRPRFGDFSFRHQGGTSTSVEVKMTYFR